MRRPLVVVATTAVCLATAASGSAQRACTINGTAGPDILFGTAGPDVICGLGGNDKLFGMSGNDVTPDRSECAARFVMGELSVSKWCISICENILNLTLWSFGPR